MTFSLYFIYLQRTDWVVLSASCFLLLICLSDTLYGKIPNLFNLVCLLFALGYHYHQQGAPGLGMSLLGLLSGLALFIVPFLMGGMGAGDVKALAVLGALLGPQNILQVFIYTGLVGGLMGLIQCLFVPQLRQTCLVWIQSLRLGLLPDKTLREPRGHNLRFPYAAAIAMGYYAYLHWGGLLKLLTT
ncbi:MAG: A24 family peptidase [Syntrophotaleaceae bacterium]